MLYINKNTNNYISNPITLRYISVFKHFLYFGLSETTKNNKNVLISNEKLKTFTVGLSGLLPLHFKFLNPFLLIQIYVYCSSLDRS